MINPEGLSYGISNFDTHLTFDICYLAFTIHLGGFEGMESSEQTFAQKFDLYGCFQCGKCTGGCPVSLKSRLNIRRLMIEGILGKNLDRVSEMEELWDCTTCKTCTLRCPRGLKPMDLVIGMRGTLIEEGHIPKTIIEAMESAYKYGNPWGTPKNKRTEG